MLTKKEEKVVLSFHSHYSQTFNEGPYIGEGLSRTLIKFLYRLAFKTLYNKADKMVAVSKAVKFDLVKNFGLKEDKIVVIYNPIFLEEIVRT